MLLPGGSVGPSRAGCRPAGASPARRRMSGPPAQVRPTRPTRPAGAGPAHRTGASAFVLHFLNIGKFFYKHYTQLTSQDTEFQRLRFMVEEQIIALFCAAAVAPGRQSLGQGYQGGVPLGAYFGCRAQPPCPSYPGPRLPS